MKLKTLLAAILILFIFPSTVFAQTTFRLNKDDNLTFNLDPGATVIHTVNVINLQDKPVEIELYATDSAVNSTGRFVVLTKFSEKNNVGNWTTFKEKTQTLNARQEKTVEFMITVPVDATPGSYAGGISIEPAAPSKVLKQTGAVVSTRVAIPIYVNVNGKKISNFSWTNISRLEDGSNNFVFSFENKGNTIIKVEGDIIIDNFYGEPSVLKLGIMTLMPNKNTSAALHWNTIPFFGFYTATAKINFSELDMQKGTYENRGTQSKSLTFTIIPWGTVFGLITLIILLVTLIIVRKVLYKKYLGKCLTYRVTEGETLVSIANKNKVSWQELAKINHLKPPFDLSQGQKILLPPKK